MKFFAKPISDADDDHTLIYEWVEVKVQEDWANHQEECGLTLCKLSNGTVIAKP